MIPRIPTLPPEKQGLLDSIVDQFSRVHGMAAVVLGGSYASGSAHAGSDMDIGLYYEDNSPFDIDEIKMIAGTFSAEPEVNVTGFYGWGPWVNGGAWVHTIQGKVDLIYRSLDQVRRTIDDAESGIWHHDYDQQPTHGFFSVIYLAETKVCIPLHDPRGLIAALKQRVQVYPPRLKQRVIADSLWSVEFTLSHARGFAAQGDVYNTVGCLTRASSYLTQALFALNEVYFMRDKKVLETIAGFALLPAGYTQDLASILAHPGRTRAELEGSVTALETLWRSVCSLPGVDYAPKFVI
jgi:hypothetical protein